MVNKEEEKHYTVCKLSIVFFLVHETIRLLLNMCIAFELKLLCL